MQNLGPETAPSTPHLTPQNKGESIFGVIHCWGTNGSGSYDITGPFPTSDSGSKYILVVQDQFSKWVEAYAIKDQSAETVARVLVHEFFSRFGVPLELHLDQGSNYDSHLFKEVCKLLEIH